MSHPGPALPLENLVIQTQDSWVMTEPKPMMATDLTKFPTGSAQVHLSLFQLKNLQAVVDNFQKHIIQAERRKGTQFRGTWSAQGPETVTHLRCLGWPPLSQNSLSPLSLLSSFYSLFSLSFLSSLRNSPCLSHILGSRL